MLKIARLTELKLRLQTTLVDEPELAETFSLALEQHDERALGDAFAQLHRGPGEVRRAVEGVMLEWLFGDDGQVSLASFVPESASSTEH